MAAACFHITVHAVGKAMLFTAVGGLSAVSGGKKDYDSLLGAARRDPFSGLVFIIGGLSMIGIPPFSGFASKFYLATAALETSYSLLVISIAVVVGTFLSIMYYFPVIYSLLSKSGETTREIVHSDRSLLLPYRISLVGFLALNLFLGLFSQPVILVIERGLAVLG